MFLAKRIHQPRYKGIAKINSLQVQYSSDLFNLLIDMATNKLIPWLRVCLKLL
jgi:hypothetical protein